MTLRKLTSTAAFLFLTLFFTACKKNITQQSQDQKQLSSNIKATTTSTLASSICREELQPDWIADTVDIATQLGTALIGNPYSVTVMRQAATDLYGSNMGITANKKYIRYKPSKLSQIESLLNSDVELFDYPLDREVIEEGDYYPQSGGTGDDGFLSDYISLAESWAEHVGQTFADRIYVFNSTPFVGQRTTTYSNNWPVAGLSSH